MRTGGCADSITPTHYRSLLSLADASGYAVSCEVAFEECAGVAYEMARSDGVG
jgi:hypothetical protein